MRLAHLVLKLSGELTQLAPEENQPMFPKNTSRIAAPFPLTPLSVASPAFAMVLALIGCDGSQKDAVVTGAAKIKQTVSVTASYARNATPPVSLGQDNPHVFDQAQRAVVPSTVAVIGGDPGTSRATLKFRSAAGNIECCYERPASGGNLILRFCGEAQIECWRGQEDQTGIRADIDDSTQVAASQIELWPHARADAGNSFTLRASVKIVQDNATDTRLCLGALGSQCTPLQNDNRLRLFTCSPNLSGPAPLTPDLTLDGSDTFQTSTCLTDSHYRPGPGTLQLQGTSVGSILHDACCQAHPLDGFACGGTAITPNQDRKLPRPTLGLPCEVEFYRASLDAVTDTATWGAQFDNAVPAGYSLPAQVTSDPPPMALRAPHGTRLMRAAEASYCQSGAVDPSTLRCLGTAPPPQAAPPTTTCEFLDETADWGRDGFSFTNQQSWIAEDSYAYAAARAMVDPLDTDFGQRYGDSARLVNFYLKSREQGSCHRRELVAVRDQHGRISGMAMVRNLPAEQLGANRRIDHHINLEVFATRQDDYAAPLLDCVRKQLGKKLLHLMRVQPAPTTKAFWEAQAIRVQREKLNGGQTWVWNTDEGYFFEPVCDAVDAPISTLPLLARTDANLYYALDDQRSLVVRASPLALPLIRQQQQNESLNTAGYPVAGFDVNATGVCAIRPRFVAGTLQDLVANDDEPHGLPIEAPGSCPGVLRDPPGVDHTTAASPSTFFASLATLTGDKRCRALNSLALIRSAMNDGLAPRPVWDGLYALTSTGEIAITEPRFIGFPGAQTQWFQVPQVSTGGLLRAETPIPDDLADEEAGDSTPVADAASYVPANQTAWEELEGDTTECGRCSELGPISNPIFDWRTKGFEFNLSGDRSYATYAHEKEPLKIESSTTPEEEVAAVAKYINNISLLRGSEFQHLNDVLKRTVTGSFFSYMWIYKNEIRAIAVVTPSHESINWNQTLPMAEFRLLGALSADDAKDVVNCILDDVPKGKILAGVRATVPTGDDARMMFWESVATTQPMVFAKRSSNQASMTTSFAFESTCSLIGRPPSEVVLNNLKGKGSFSAAYELADGNIMSVPIRFTTSYSETSLHLSNARTLGYPAGDLNVGNFGLCATAKPYEINSQNRAPFESALQQLVSEPINATANKQIKRCNALESLFIMQEASGAQAGTGVFRSCIRDFQLGLYGDGHIKVVDPINTSSDENLCGLWQAKAEAQQRPLIDNWFGVLGGQPALDNCRCGQPAPTAPLCAPDSAGQPTKYDGASDACTSSPPPGGNAPGTNENCATAGDKCTGGSVCRRTDASGIAMACVCPTGTVRQSDGSCRSNLADAALVFDCSEFGDGYEFCPASGSLPGRCVPGTPTHDWSNCGACGLTCQPTQICDDDAGPLGCMCPADLPRWDGTRCLPELPAPTCPSTLNLDTTLDQCVLNEEAQCCEGKWRDPEAVGVCCDDTWRQGENTCEGDEEDPNQSWDCQQAPMAINVSATANCPSAARGRKIFLPQGQYIVKATGGAVNFFGCGVNCGYHYALSWQVTASGAGGIIVPKGGSCGRDLFPTASAAESAAVGLTGNITIPAGGSSVSFFMGDSACGDNCGSMSAEIRCR